MILKRSSKAQPGADEGEDIREGFDPNDLPVEESRGEHVVGAAKPAVQRFEGPGASRDELGEDNRRDRGRAIHGAESDERNVWEEDDGHNT